MAKTDAPAIAAATTYTSLRLSLKKADGFCSLMLSGSVTSIPPEKAPKPGLDIYGCAPVNSYPSINPNKCMPSLVHVKGDGTSVTVFESAACLLYIASEFDKEHKISYPFDSSGYRTQLSWIASYDPMIAQASHFNRYASELVPYGVQRCASECRRLYRVLDQQLACAGIIPIFRRGDRMPVADFAVFTFAHSTKWCGIDINQYHNVKAWHDKLAQRPVFQKGLRVPLALPDSYRMMRKHVGQVMKGGTNRRKGDVVPVSSDTTAKAS
ncbi:glutathione S-transferase [Xylaria palmicola]|nr:glutathione S-transferase [Xylaria palmicola]